MHVLFEDAAMIAVNKPAGLAVIPTRTGDPAHCAWKQLERARGERLWVVHRIDQDTSGVLVFARTADAHRALNTAFETRAVEKTYRAFVIGRVEPEQGAVRVPLHTARKGKMRPALEGEPQSLASVTRYRVRTRKLNVTDLEVAPETGRQHQIRVHMRAIGHPLIVDPLYNSARPACPAGSLGEGSPALGRLTLHAESIAVPHPLTRETLTVRAPLAPDLESLAQWMER